MANELQSGVFLVRREEKGRRREGEIPAERVRRLEAKGVNPFNDQRSTINVNAEYLTREYEDISLGCEMEGKLVLLLKQIAVKKIKKAMEGIIKTWVSRRRKFLISRTFYLDILPTSIYRSIMQKTNRRGKKMKGCGECDMNGACFTWPLPYFVCQ